MSSTDQSSYTHHFRWDSSVPLTVAIRGSFDNWQSSLTLQKHPSGKFSAPIQLPFGTKVSYKYVVDGTWRHNPNEPTETDSVGNINNVFQVPRPPSPLIDPATVSVPLHPNSVSTMSSNAPMEESSESLPVQNTPSDSGPPINSELNRPVDMSIAFPSTSPDQVPELLLPPTQPGGPKRTTSLFSSATRFARPSHRTTSLFSSAPGTPTDKSSPAGASVSNVVSALAGVAATAIPAAIFAVTGKDITISKSKSSHDAPAVTENIVPPQISPKLSAPEVSLNPDCTPQELPATDPTTKSGLILPLTAPITPSVTYPDKENHQPEHNALVNSSGTHREAYRTSTPSGLTLPAVESESVQAVQPGPKEPVPSPDSTAIPTVTTSLPLASQPPTAASTPIQPEQPIKETDFLTKRLDSTPHHPEHPAVEQSIKEPELPPERLNLPPENCEQSNANLTPSPPKDVSTDTKLLSSSEDAHAASPATTTAKEERSGTSQEQSTTPPRVSILIQNSHPFPTPTDNESTDKSTTGSKIEPASLGPKARKGEFIRKTSGWRHSVGSIRSRKTSCDIDRSTSTHNNDPNSAPNENDDPSSPRGKRMSGIFQKIKSALSPNKLNKSPTKENITNGNGKKRNSFGRTATMTQG